MANPNIVAVTDIKGKLSGAALTTNSADIITAPANKVLKVNAMYISNIDGTNAVDITVGVYDSSATATYYLASTMSLPADTTLDILSKSIYLEEGDKITARAGANSDATILVSYEEIA